MDKKDVSKLPKSAQLDALKKRIAARSKTIESELGKPLYEPRTGGVVYLLLDTSSSMSTTSKLSQARNGALSFAEDAFSKGYVVGLIRFASSAAHLCDPSSNTYSLSQYLNGLTASGSTNMADGLRLATEKLMDKARLRTIVLVTDGMPDSQDAALDAAGFAKSKGIDIIAIGTDDADYEFLKRIATRADLAVSVPQNRLQDGIASAAKLLPQGTEGRGKPADTMPLNLALEIPKGSARVILKKGTPLPCSGTLPIRLTNPNANKLDFHIMQGVGAKFAGYRSLGNTEVVVPPGFAPGNSIITLKFYLDINGVLHVSAKTDSAENVTVKITSKGGLSQEEIQKLLDEFGDEANAT